MSDLTKILAENQKEIFKLIAPLNKKQTVHPNVQDSDSEPENVSVARTSTPVKTQTATNPKTTPINSRNSLNSFFILPAKNDPVFLLLLSKIVIIRAWNKLKLYRKVPFSTQLFFAAKEITNF